MRSKPTKTDQQIEDTLPNLLLPVARLLVRGGIGIDELVRAAKRAYLRAAMQVVVRQDGRVNISRLSVATGMTRKEVAALLGNSQKSGGAAPKKRGQQRALRVLKGWMTDPRFRNSRGYPEQLRFGGSKKSFAFLVKLYGGDVTPKAVLRELERMEIVEVTKPGALRLRALGNRHSLEVNSQISELARLFEDFALAIIRSNANTEDPSFIGFKDSIVPSTGDAAYFMRRFSGRAAALLEDFERWSVGREATKLASTREHGAVRVGLGVYLLRSERPIADRASGKSRVRAAIRPSKRRRN